MTPRHITFSSPRRAPVSWGMAGLARIFTLYAAIVTASGWIALTAEAQSGDDDRISVDRWSQQVWERALQGRADVVFEQWSRVPATHRREPVRQLRASLDRFESHLDLQIQARVKTYQESLEQMDQHMRDGDLQAALIDALGAHEASLSRTEIGRFRLTGVLVDRDAVLRSAVVNRVVERAAAAAELAESQAEWLDAQNLYYRLNALFNVDRRYRDDLERISRRIVLLRLFYPRRLHELNNQERIRMGQEPLEAFQDQSDDWRIQLKGIDRSMVADALDAAATTHLWQHGWPPLIVAGYDGIETLVTTSDLADVFPRLADDWARRSFLDYVQGERAHWEGQDQGSRMRTSSLLRALLAENSKTISLPDQVILHQFGEGAVASLDDFSGMVWPYERPMLDRQLDGTYSGVGLQITLDEAGRLRIVTPLEDTPAHRAGLRADDLITEIDHRPTLGITLNQAIDQITGPDGTPVVLTVKREGEDETRQFEVRRDRIRIMSVKGWKRQGYRDWDYLIDPEHQIGYIRVTGFFPDTSADFDEAIDEMKGQGARALILDLRFNPGGRLSQAVELCNRFVAQGVLVSTARPNRRPREERARPHKAASLAGIPVVVLINEGSASASEIVAGCLQDHSRAVIVGTRSYGKGSVQKIVPVARDRARLRLTTEHYLLPSGASIHRDDNSTQWGVKPDLVVRMTPEQVAESIRRLRDADIPFDPRKKPTPDELRQRDPVRLLEGPLDLQLQAAVVVLQSKLLGDEAGQAMLIER